MRLKVEIDAREHAPAFDIIAKPFAIRSRWFEGDCSIATYRLEEMLGTQLRALYQRKTGRDLFDPDTALRLAAVDPTLTLEAFNHSISEQGVHVSRAEFEENPAGKLEDPVFTGDLHPLPAAGSEWEPVRAAERVGHELLERLPGESWKGHPEPESTSATTNNEDG